jgi:hypothetical protein
MACIEVASVHEITLSLIHWQGKILPEEGEGYGRITLLLSAGGSVPTYALTAGHLFPPGAGEVFALEPSGRWALGRICVNGLDLPWRERMDMALIELRPEARHPLTSRVSSVGEVGPKVRVCAPSLGDEPGPAVRITGRGLAASFRAPARPDGLLLRGLLRVTPCQTAPGDSGSPLLDAADPGRAVGLLVGVQGGASVFEPLPKALAVCSRWLGQELSVTSGSSSSST